MKHDALDVLLTALSPLAFSKSGIPVLMSTKKKHKKEAIHKIEREKKIKITIKCMKNEDYES